jgi:5'-3' exoribonuclease 1
MVRLQSQLQFFVSNKISTDPLWQRVRVVLSGHETPGEGEHKIMDFIRHEKAQPSYNPNIRHCLYGLDADLVMLGMATHDPHFSLLREEVRFSGKKNASANKRTPTAEDTTFHLLHLSLLREYLDHEFSDVRPKIVNFEYDIEHIIDDWILLGFLVGNDFLPNLPNLHINKGALMELYDLYKAVLPSLGGYLNVHGELNLARFEKFILALSNKEMERFDDIYSDAKWLEGKTAAKTAGGKHMVKDTPGPANVFEMLSGLPEPGVNQSRPQQDADLLRLLTSADEFLDEDATTANTELSTEVDSAQASEDSSGRGDNYHMEFRQHKRDYYINKLGYDKVDASVLREQAECYVRGIQWNLHYYYNGCMSWSWYYPHHFAPWITDIRDFANMKMDFEMSRPFYPFEQLMAVLPSASRELLPVVLQGLMMNETSPVIDYYPKDFECDLNGKQQEWEAVVLIPFINEKRLLDAMKPVLPSMRPEETGRNKHGPMQVYTHTPDSSGPLESPAYFPAITQNFAVRTEVWRAEWDVAIKDLKKGLMDGVRMDVFFPGFPTLKHIPHSAKLSTAGVRVFEQSSRGQNTLLLLKDQRHPDIREVAQELVGMKMILKNTI